MKATIRLTLSGLVSALRWRAHALAEKAENGYPDARETGSARGLASRRNPGRRRLPGRTSTTDIHDGGGKR